MLSGRDHLPSGAKQRLASRQPAQKGATGSVLSLPDNREQAVRDRRLESIILEGSNRKLQREFSRKKLWQLQAVESWLERKAISQAEYWPVMEISDYLKRHGLKIKNKRSAKDTTILTLSDNSAIFVFDEKLWRHESASRQAVFYDSAHAQNPDAAKTHFWTKAGAAANES